MGPTPLLTLDVASGPAPAPITIPDSQTLALGWARWCLLPLPPALPEPIPEHGVSGSGVSH